MSIFISKFIPLFLYPLGLATVLLFLTRTFFRQRQHWQQRLIVLAFLLLWLGGNHWVTMALVRSLEYQHLPAAELPEREVIVILGGSTRSFTHPRPIVEVNEAGDRLLYGGWLYKQGKAPHILVSGGGISWLGGGTLSEAERMVSVLSMMSIPEEVIWLEERARNTEENARFTREILQAKGIKQILLVTSAMHMPRSVMLFEKEGFDVIPAPTDFISESPPSYNNGGEALAGMLVNFIPNANNLDVTTRVLKEYIGMLFYRLQGY